MRGGARVVALVIAVAAASVLVLLTVAAGTSGSRLGASLAGAGAVLLVVVGLTRRPTWLGPAVALLAAGPLLALRGRSGFDAAIALDAVLLVVAAEAALAAARPAVAVVEPDVATRRLVRAIVVVAGAAMVSVVVTVAAVTVSTNTPSATVVGTIAAIAVPVLALGIARSTR